MKLVNENKSALDFYKENKVEIKNHLYNIINFDCIDAIVVYKEKTEDVYMTISSKSIEAYLKDDSKLGLIEICDFLSYGYNNDKLTLDEIKEANSRQILEAVLDNSYDSLNKNRLSSLENVEIDMDDIDLDF